MTTCRDCGVPAGKPFCLKCYHARARMAAAASELLTRLRIAQMAPDPMYLAKFDEHGDVRLGWSLDQWILDRVADIPATPSPDTAEFLRQAA